MNTLLLLVVVAISAGAGAMLVGVYLHWRIDQLLTRSLQASDEQLRAVERAVAAVRDKPVSAAELEWDDKLSRARQEGARAPLEQVVRPGAHAANDRLAHALDAPRALNTEFQDPGRAPGRTSRGTRPCKLCDLVRGFFSS